MLAYSRCTAGVVALASGVCRPLWPGGRRVVGVPRAIIPALCEHLSIFVTPEPGALVFPGAKGGPLRRSNFNKMSAWPYALRAVGAPGLHVHDLRHTGNTFAASGSAGIKDLMARMGHDSERAAMIYQHRARGEDHTITSARLPLLGGKGGGASA